MKKSYTGDVTDIAYGIKRLYVDEVPVKLPCPKCDKQILHCTDYISYGEGSLYFYCAEEDGGCEHEWDVPVELTLQITLVL